MMGNNEDWCYDGCYTGWMMRIGVMMGVILRMGVMMGGG